MKGKELVKFIFTYQYIENKKWIFKADIDWSKTDIEIDGTWSTSPIVWKNGKWIDGTWENGEWENGTWYDGIWEGGNWYKGIWKKGTWKGGNIYDPESKKYKYSLIPPNKCTWSLSYGK